MGYGVSVVLEQQVSKLLPAVSAGVGVGVGVGVGGWRPCRWA